MGHTTKQETGNKVLLLQTALCAALLGALLLCRTVCPPLFRAAAQEYKTWFEAEDEAPQLVRFAAALLDNVPLLSVSAQTSAAKQAAVSSAMPAGGLAAFFTAPTATPVPTPRPAPDGCSLAPYPGAVPLTFPLDTVAWTVSSGYGWRVHPLRGKEIFHEGVDLACSEGVDVLSAQDGVVMTDARSESYGNWLCVRSTDGTETRYAHLQYSFVQQGELVRAGQRLGTAGSTGDATGPHLHFELLYRGIRCDPAASLGLFA